MKKYIFAIAFLALPFLAGTTQATSVTFADYQADIVGQETMTVAVTALGVDMTVTANTFNSVTGLDSLLTFDDIDNGIGIGDDEITGNGNGESITISFSEDIFMESFQIVDLFYDSYDGSLTNFQESGYYFLNGIDNRIYFDAPPSNIFEIDSDSSATAGGLTLSINNVISSITFGVDRIDGLTLPAKNDYALVGFDATPVPEPATMLLFGAGLAGLATFSRRKKK